MIHKMITQSVQVHLEKRLEMMFATAVRPWNFQLGSFTLKDSVCLLSVLVKPAALTRELTSVFNILHKALLWQTTYKISQSEGGDKSETVGRTRPSFTKT